MKALITRKVGMTTLIAGDGSVTPVTLLSVSDNVVLGKKTVERDGYAAVVVGAGTTKKLRKPLAGALKNVKATPAIIKEFRLNDSVDETDVGSHLGADVFSVGDLVSVSGTSKGKGWSGTIKRHNFHRGRKTHGGRSYRRVGSIGSMYPQHILKGKKMAGRSGHAKVTTRGLKVAFVDAKAKTLGVAGSVPGPKKSVVLIKEMV